MLRCSPRLPLLAAVLVCAAATGVRAAAQDDVPAEWQTRAESSGFRATSSYDETLAFLRRLEGRFPEMRLLFYGTSAEGRPLPVVVVSRERAFTAAEAGKLPKPIVLVVNGIHAGEIDGKDSCLMILRDLALGRRTGLLDAATLLVVPIYNVDGHERVSPYNRPNQDGPVEGMGFRTTAAGLDLNRDHMKLQSAEARALVGLFSEWRPHLHVDDHVSDGFDHAWVLGYGYAEAPQAPAPVDAWFKNHFPAIVAATKQAGTDIGPYVSLRDEADLGAGFESPPGIPRYSTGYFNLRNRPSILVETHSYKPYRDRVRGNRDFLLALLAEIGRDPASLRAAVEEAEAAEVARGRAGAPPSEIALTYELGEADSLRIPLYAWRTETSVVTGQPFQRQRRGEAGPPTFPWQHRPRVAKSVPRPRGYLVLPGWPQIEQPLRAHRLQVWRLDEPAEIEVETSRLAAPRFAAQTYQGLHQVESVEVTRRLETRRFPAGSLWLPADQPDFEVAAHLLEPEAPDSLLAWGLLSSAFERKEYIDLPVLEDLAREMLKDPTVAADWEAALKDETFAKDARARQLWWYRRTRYWDETVGLLPIFRAMARPTLRTTAWP
jgi:Zinc carboxypeptidase